jgi:hypothetical protein
MSGGSWRFTMPKQIESKLNELLNRIEAKLVELHADFK